MEFSVNHPILFAIAGIVILAVLGQSCFFLFRALRRAKEIGMDEKKLRKIMISSAIFTIAPAVSILVGVLALSKSLGVALPWLRLSIIGSLSYETIAAETTQKSLDAGAMTASGFVTVLFVMTFGIIALGVWFIRGPKKSAQTEDIPDFTPPVWEAPAEEQEEPHGEA